MLYRIVSLSVTFRVLVVGLAAVVMGLGLVQLSHSTAEVYPEFGPTEVQIQTEAAGLSAAEVEQLITVPLEQDLLNGTAWLDTITSESVPGLSSVEMVFEPGISELKARQAVQERLTQVGGLPQVGSPPALIQPLSSTSRVMMIGLTSKSKDVSLTDMSVLSRWNIKPRLLGIPGVANVVIWGERDRQLQVQVDPQRLRSRGVSLNQVVSTTGNALWVSPLTFVEASTPGTGGFIDTPNQRLAIQHVLPITTAKDLASVTIEETGNKGLRLGDVANVVEGNQPLIGDAMPGSGPGMMLVVEKTPGADTREVTQAVEDAMTSLEPGLSGIRVDTSVYRPADFIDSAMHNAGVWGLIVLGAVSVLLGAYFLSWRVALISLVSVSLSAVAAMYVLHLTGTSFNMMVLAGLALALGIVIDDVVIAMDRIRSRLDERGRSAEGRSVAEVVVDATTAVRRPALYATAIMLLAVVPIVFLTGVGGAFAKPLALSYALAVGVSTLVALTVTPVLASLLLARTPLRHRPNPVLGWVHRGFEWISPRYLLRPGLVLITVAALAGAGFAVLPQLDNKSPIPVANERQLLIHVQAAPGTSLPEMSRISSIAAGELRSVPGVKEVGAHLGRARASDQVVNVNSGEFWVSLAGSANYDSTVAAITRTMRDQPELSSKVVNYAQDRVDEVRAENDEEEPVIVRVFGHDLGVLRHKAQEVSHLLSQVPGIVSPKVPPLVEEPTLEVKVNLAAAQRYGVKPGDVRRTAATYFSGLPVGSLYEEQKVFDVVVWGSPPTRATPQNVSELLVDTPSGTPVRLSDVATVRVVPSPTVIEHDSTSRSLDVTADISGRDLGSVLSDVRHRLQSVPMPNEYHAEVLSDVAHQQSQDLRVAELALAVVIGSFLLLQAAFGSWRLATLGMLALPLAGVGGVLAAFAVGGVMSVGALIGLLAVLGIAVRGIVLLIRGYQQIEPRADGTAAPEPVLAATRERVGPVLLTALAMALAVIPLVVGSGVAGFEVLHPMGVVILGGLVTSTLVTLCIVPALYLRFFPFSPGAFRRRRPGPEPSPKAGPEPSPKPGPAAASDGGALERRGASGGRRPGTRCRRYGTAAAGLLVLGLGLSACSQAAGAGPAPKESAEQPAQVDTVPGTDSVRLTVDPDVVKRLGIRTETVKQAPLPGHGPARQTLIPLAAVIYDEDGATFAYTNPRPLVYVRVPVSLGTVEDEVAVVKSGLSPGNRVVTVGVAELLGAEHGVEGE